MGFRTSRQSLGRTGGKRVRSYLAANGSGNIRLHSGGGDRPAQRGVGIPTAEIYGVITFYSQFRLRPTGKNIIKICDGTACHVNASSLMIRTIEEELKITNNETTEDGVFTLQKVACLGCCSLSPVVMINEETYGRLTPKKVQQLLKEYRERSGEECPPSNSIAR